MLQIRCEAHLVGPGVDCEHLKIFKDAKVRGVARVLEFSPDAKVQCPGENLLSCPGVAMVTQFAPAETVLNFAILVSSPS